MKNAQGVPGIDDNRGDEGDLDGDRKQDRERESVPAATLQAEQCRPSSKDQIARQEDIGDEYGLEDSRNGAQRAALPRRRRAESRPRVAHGFTISLTVWVT